MSRFVVGIPSVRRRRDYVERTIAALLANAGPAIDSCTFVLLNAEQPPSAHRAIDRIRARHARDLAAGRLRIVDAPRHAIEVAEVEWELPLQTRWRAKQVLDCVALMEAARPLGEFYLHLEDDIAPCANWVDGIEAFVHEQESRTDWASLAFYCCLPFPHRSAFDLPQFRGFIGLLFRMREVEPLTAYLRRRYRDEPVDHLVRDYLMEQQGTLRVHQPSLFEHVGYRSSLPLRVQSNRAWWWAGDRNAAQRFVRRARRSLHVRWLWLRQALFGRP